MDDKQFIAMPTTNIAPHGTHDRASEWSDCEHDRLTFDLASHRITCEPCGREWRNFTEKRA